MSKLNEKVNEMSERSFKLLQFVVAIVLAAAGGICILFLDNRETDSFNTVGVTSALIICGGVPMLLEHMIERPMRHLNRYLVALLALILAGCIVCRFIG